jgi:hypothetical protein
MRSVRLDEALEAQLEKASRASGESASNIIRHAVEKHCEQILSQRLAPRLADIIGVVNSHGGRARRTGKAFAENLRSRNSTDR